MSENSMLGQIHSLPALLREVFDRFDAAARETFDHNLCLSMKRLFLVGCGDSHHAPLGAELAVERVGGVPCEPVNSGLFARYGVQFIPDTGPNTNVVIGVSVSGEVARTIESLRMARACGATAVALTGSPGTPIAKAADRVLRAEIPPFEFAPGVRSFAASLLHLYLVAARLGEVRGRLSNDGARAVRGQIRALADAAEHTIELCEPVARRLVEEWGDAEEFVFCGSGPNFASALFSAAKVLEASGDPALGQDVEEWAHLQYFARAENTPTFIITALERDESRAKEVATAAKTIGRRVAGILPEDRAGSMPEADFVLPVAAGVDEAFWTMVGTIPGELIAAYRAEMLGEQFFRGFGGGRSEEGGGGISRIRTGVQIERPFDK